MSGWSYVVTPPDDGWIRLPPPDADLDGWAAQVSGALAADGPARDRLAHELRAFGLAARRRAGELTAVWVPDPVSGVVASLVTDRVRLDGDREGDREGDLDALAAGVRPEGGPAPQVDRVRLPAGPAVRVRRRERTEDGQRTESVTHLVAPGVADPAGRPVGVLLVTSWAEGPAGDELAALADDVADGLAVTRG